MAKSLHAQWIDADDDHDDADADADVDDVPSSLMVNQNHHFKNHFP